MMLMRILCRDILYNSYKIIRKDTNMYVEYKKLRYILYIYILCLTYLRIS